MPHPSEPIAGDVLAGKYRVERVLGRGGMGIVVAATHLVLGHQVAIKFLLPSAATNKETAARFLREAKVTARLKSAHIAKTLDMGTFDDGRPFLVMELLEGHDLGAELSERRDVPVGEVVKWVLQACEGLAEAHAAGVVHRDLKPSNLFLTTDSSGTTVVKVLDFGISKLMADADGVLTSSEASFGSPIYMSPEQLRSSKGTDTRSDVWAIGVILYEALSGDPPFTGETVFAIAQSIMTDPAVSLEQRRRDVPSGLSAAVMRCLAKAPAERPQSVAELADTLAPFAGPSGKERASRVRGALAERVVVGPGHPDQSEKWTAATTQRDVTRRPALVRGSIIGLITLSAIVAGGVAWRAHALAARSDGNDATVASVGTSSSAVDTIVADAALVAPSAVVLSPAAPETAPVPSSRPAGSGPKKKRPPASPDPSSAPTASAPQGPFIEQRTN